MPAGFRIGLADKLFLCSFLPFPLSGVFLPLHAKKRPPHFCRGLSAYPSVFSSVLFVSYMPVLLFSSVTVSIFVHKSQVPADMHVPIPHLGAFV